MIRRYLDAALSRARYTQLEDGSYGAEVRGLRGVIATGATLVLATAWLALGSNSGNVEASAASVDAHDLLLLRFDGSLMGDAGEVPTQAQGYVFQPGVSDQGVALPAPNQLAYSSASNIDGLEGSFECWLKPTWAGNDGQGHFVLRYGVGGGILIGKDGGNNMRIILNRFGAHPGGEVGVAFNVSTWQANTWHYLTFTWSNSAKKLQAYADGALQAEQTFGIELPAIGDPTFQIGGDGAGGYAEALLDNLRISDTVRSPLEISNHMLEGLNDFVYGNHGRDKKEARDARREKLDQRNLS